MKTSDRSAALFLDILARLSDVLGEKGMRALVQYAAAEVGARAWATMLPPRELPGAIDRVAEAIMTRVEVVSAADGNLVLRLWGHAGSDERAAEAREAVVAGFLQGIERRRTGRAPDVRFEAAPPEVRAEGGARDVRA